MLQVWYFHGNKDTFDGFKHKFLIYPICSCQKSKTTKIVDFVRTLKLFIHNKQPTLPYVSVRLVGDRKKDGIGPFPFYKRLVIKCVNGTVHMRRIFSRDVEPTHPPKSAEPFIPFFLIRGSIVNLLPCLS
jgi:hypothetical protein